MYYNVSHRRIGFNAETAIPKSATLAQQVLSRCRMMYYYIRWCFKPASHLSQFIALAISTFADCEVARW